MSEPIRVFVIPEGPVVPGRECTVGVPVLGEPLPSGLR